MPLNLKTASGGSVILTGANTASDKTITVPAADGNMLYADSSGNAQINSGYGSLATGYVARAWVNFNGTGTVAIRASGNVSSITDNGTGDYTINFTTAMPDANYSLVSQFEWANPAFAASARSSTIVTLATGSSRFRTGFLDASAIFTAEDQSQICIAILR